jgi:O-antigen/teichoic acid export membrane protein
VIVRETLVPAALIGFALILHACGVVATGLAWAYLLASVLGLIAALHYQPAAASGSRLRRLPRELFAYAVPLWLAEIANSSLLRLSILVVAAFADPVSVGVWGIVTQFATAMRAIRTAFDPIVTVIAADIARNHDARRLSAVLSYSAQLVSLSQFPLFAFLLVFADLILPLYGPAFGAGALPLIVLCSFWLLNGAAGLAGVVVTGYGRSKLTLLNTLGTIAAQLSLLLVLVPRMGLVGGAIAVGASYSFQHVFQLVELKRLTGGFQFSSRAAQPLLPAAAGGLGAALVHGSVGLRLDDPWLARSLTFSTFLAIYAAVTLWYWRRGELRAPE